jgi:hypothetical protein
MLDYATWEAQAVAAFNQHDIVAPIAERTWRDAFIRGLTPSEAAECALVDALNAMPAHQCLVKLRV